jgi:hypothetical protein
MGKSSYISILKQDEVIKEYKLFICSSSIVYGLYIITPYSNIE